MLDSATPKMKRYGVNDSDSFSDWLPDRRHRASATLWNISLTETLGIWCLDAGLATMSIRLQHKHVSYAHDTTRAYRYII